MDRRDSGRKRTEQSAKCKRNSTESYRDRSPTRRRSMDYGRGHERHHECQRLAGATRQRPTRRRHSSLRTPDPISTTSGVRLVGNNGMSWRSCLMYGMQILTAETGMGEAYRTLLSRVGVFPFPASLILHPFFSSLAINLPC